MSYIFCVGQSDDCIIDQYMSFKDINQVMAINPCIYMKEG